MEGNYCGHGRAVIADKSSLTAQGIMSTEVLNNLSDHFDATLLYWAVYKMDATPEVKILLVKLKLH